MYIKYSCTFKGSLRLQVYKSTKNKTLKENSPKNWYKKLHWELNLLKKLSSLADVHTFSV